MSELYRFFDSITGDIREYNADKFAEYYRGIFFEGISAEDPNMLKVSANGVDMNVTVATGIAFIKGYYYKNDAPIQVTIDSEGVGNDRIDLIVLRLDINNRTLLTKVIKGTPDVAAPQVPALTQDIDGAGIYEYALAEVTVRGGQSFIAVNDVKNEGKMMKIVNSNYRQIFISQQDPLATDGYDGDVWITY